MRRTKILSKDQIWAVVVDVVAIVQLYFRVIINALIHFQFDPSPSQTLLPCLSHAHTSGRVSVRVVRCGVSVCTQNAFGQSGGRGRRAGQSVLSNTEPNQDGIQRIAQASGQVGT